MLATNGTTADAEVLIASVVDDGSANGGKDDGATGGTV